MTHRIHKYEINRRELLALPFGSQIIHFGLQRGKFHIWVQVPVDTERMVTREFRIHGTGSKIDINEEYPVASTICQRTNEIWHLYDVLEHMVMNREKLKVQKNSAYGKLGEIQLGTTSSGAVVNTPAQELEILKRKYAEICEDNRRKDEEIAELKAKKFTRFNGDECWIYQGDGEDNLHSLVCPVVIDPTELMHIIELAEQYKGLCD